MKHLVYGILRERAKGCSSILAGMEETAVAMVAENGLVAAFSRGPRTWSVPEVPQLLAYAKVIEALSQNETVLPMRFGCLLDTETEIRRLLARRGHEFHATLERLEGCVEMGLGVILRAAPSSSPDPTAEITKSVATGKAYLLRRRSYYGMQDDWRAESEAALQRWRSAVSGLFVQCCAEAAPDHAGRRLALHFLVQRDKVQPFRQTVEQLKAAGMETIRLTGPWPPYNFVS